MSFHKLASLLILYAVILNQGLTAQDTLRVPSDFPSSGKYLLELELSGERVIKKLVVNHK